MASPETDTLEIAEAIAKYTRAIQLNAHDGEAVYQRGLAYAKLNRLAQAVQDLKQATSMFPNDGRGPLALGMVRARMPQSRSQAGSDLSCALPLLSSAVESNPNEPYWLTCRAQGFRYLALLAPYPSMGPGVARAALLELAAADITRSLALNAANPAALLERSLIRVASGAIEQDLETVDATPQCTYTSVIKRQYIPNHLISCSLVVHIVKQALLVELNVMRAIVPPDDDMARAITWAIETLSRGDPTCTGIHLGG